MAYEYYQSKPSKDTRVFSKKKFAKHFFYIFYNQRGVSRLAVVASFISYYLRKEVEGIRCHPKKMRLAQRPQDLLESFRL